MEIGEKINSLTFMGLSEPKIEMFGKRKMGIFMCDCGFTKSYDYSQIKLGSIKMCFSCAVKLRGKMLFKHGLIKHPLYQKWQDMKNRCYNSKVSKYKYYGGRGISVCNEWRNDFLEFYNWSISHGWEDGLQIERINNDSNYSPENCEYITRIEQSYNKRNTRYIEIDGTKICLAKLMRDNNKAHKYKSAHFNFVTKGKSADFIINKYNLKLE